MTALRKNDSAERSNGGAPLKASTLRQSSSKLLAKFARCVPGALYQLRCPAHGPSQFSFVSERFADLFEVSAHDVAENADAIFDRVHPEDRKPVSGRMREAGLALSPWRDEYRVFLPGGGLKWLSTYALPERDDDGGTVWHGHVTDVSEIYEVRARGRFSDVLFDQTDRGIIITDRNNTILDTNAAFEAITGYSREEVVGKNPKVLSSGRQGPEFYRAMWKSLQTNGRWAGEINNRRKNGEIYVEQLTIAAIPDKSGNIANYVACFSDITRERQAEATIRRLASIDPLTGLANRHLAAEQLSLLLDQAQRTNTVVAIFLVDLDHFKSVNDHHGHHIGDEVLIGVAGRFLELVRDGDVLARLGGDEFLLGVGGLAGPEDVSLIAERLVASLHAPICVAGEEIDISPSVGVSLSPTDGADLPTLLKYADEAMYDAKAEGRGRYRFFSPIMHSRALEKAKFVGRLRKAVAQNAFKLHFQEQVDMETGKIVSVEALLRATVDGLGSPAEFVPLAEELNLISPLGRFTIEHALRQMKAWIDLGEPLERIAINVSPKQFADPMLVASIADLLEETGLPASMIEVEVTETTAMHDAEEAALVLRRLKKLGVYIAIDDFGTGYSSLAYLKRFPIDRIKIDRAFVRNLETLPDDIEIVKAILSIAEAMHLSVLAEGVETEGQRAILAGLGCGFAQGYLFGKPKPAAEMCFAPPSNRDQEPRGYSWTSH